MWRDYTNRRCFLITVYENTNPKLKEFTILPSMRKFSKKNAGILFQGAIFHHVETLFFGYSPIKTGVQNTPKMPDTWSTRPHRTCLKGKRNLALKNPPKKWAEGVWAGQMLTLQGN